MRIARRPVIAALALVASAVAVAAGTYGANAAPVEQFLVATGPGPGGGPHVKLFTATGAQEVAGFYAYAPGFTGGVSVALGDIDGNGTLEVVTGAGPGGGPHVRVFTDRGAPIDKWGFMAYGTTFTGGVNVAVADADGDGDHEIVTAPMGNGGPHVRVWDIVSDKPAVQSEFMAYNPNFFGGVQVSGAFVDNSDFEGIVTAAGPGGGPHVITWNADGEIVGSWYAYEPKYGGGVSVSHFSENNDAIDEIVTSALAGQGHVRSFSVTGVPGAVSFMAFDPAVQTGAAIGSIDGDVDGPFVVGPYRAGTGPCSVDAALPNCVRAHYIRGYDETGAATFQALPYPGFFGGVRVAGGFGLFDATPPTTTTSSTSTTTSTSTTSTSTTSTSTTTTSTSTTTTSTTTTLPTIAE